MRLSRMAVTALAVVGACGDSSVPDGEQHVGALAIHLTDLKLGAQRATYQITGEDLQPISGVVDLKDGVINSVITGIPAGADRQLKLELIAKGQTVCTLTASSLAIDEGRSSQVVVKPTCGPAAPGTVDRKKKINHAPVISTLFASRSLAQLREHVALAVLATDEDGDPLTYHWTESVPGFGFTAKGDPATAWVAGPFGASNTLTVTVSDGRGGVATASVVVDVEQGVTGPATCAVPSPIKIGDRVRGLTIGGASELSPSCGGFGGPKPPPGMLPPPGPAAGVVPSEAPERVFELVLTETQTFSVSTTGSAFNAVVYVRQGDCAAGAELGCKQNFEIPNGLVFENAAPGTYYIVVDGASRFDRGEFTLTVGTGTLPEDCQNGFDDNNDGNFDCADPECSGKAGCLECVFDCDPDPNDCFAGGCDRFTGKCITFPEFGTKCEADGDPATLDICFDGLCQSAAATCGNGFFDPGEQCDDGNQIPGDGCEPDCQLTTCGGGFCDDGNRCTVDRCTDPVNGTCASDPVPDGTPCELDFDPNTIESCQAGTCVGAPIVPPDPALIVLDPAVLNDPAFSLEAMHDRLASDGNGSALFEQWASTFSLPLNLNNDVAIERFGFTNFVAGLPRRADGFTDLAQAGFRASAFVNRIDLKKPGTCGESRVVYTKETGVFDGGNRMTLIFEFGVPDDGSNCRNATERWTALRGLEGEALRAATVQLMLDNSTAPKLNQFRTNEFIQAPFWELREFHLVAGEFHPHPVADTPPFALQDDPTFRQFVIANASRFNGGAREGGILPLSMLAAASNAGGQRFFFGNIVPSLPGLEANFNIMTCSGCHLTETGTQFVHVAERLENQPSNLSFFLRSELEFRATVVDSVLAAP
jgi:cysteine-rich repeat protein